MRILEDLWYGNICPIEQLDYQAEEYRKLVQQAIPYEKQLLSSLSSTQEAVVEKLRSMDAQMQAIIQCNAFMAGYRLATQLIVAAMLPPK